MTWAPANSFSLLLICLIPACGGSASSDDEPCSQPSAEERALSATPPRGCKSWAQWFCADYSDPSTCSCDADAPNDPLECVIGTQTGDQLVCEGDPCAEMDDPLCDVHQAGCSCASSRVDCPPSQQVCMRYAGPRFGCICEPDRPASSADCDYTFQFLCEAPGPSHCTCVDLQPEDDQPCDHQERALRASGIEMTCELECAGAGDEFDCECFCVDVSL